jgi:hypothetical protein
LFDDIEAKGATRNTNTKPNEKCHGPIRRTYLRRTNFKNIAEQVRALFFFVKSDSFSSDPIQVLRLDHRFLIAHSIRLDIEDHDEIVASRKNRLLSGSEDDEDNLDGDPDDTFHVKLGAAQNEQTFEDLEQLHANDNAFKRFRIKLADFLSDSLPAHGIPLPNAKRIKFTPNETVCRSIFLLCLK